MWQVKEREMLGTTPKFLAGATGWRCHSLTWEYSRAKMFGVGGCCRQVGENKDKSSVLDTLRLMLQ